MRGQGWLACDGGRHAWGEGLKKEMTGFSCLMGRMMASQCVASLRKCIGHV